MWRLFLISRKCSECQSFFPFTRLSEEIAQDFSLLSFLLFSELGSGCLHDGIIVCTYCKTFNDNGMRIKWAIRAIVSFGFQTINLVYVLEADLGASEWVSRDSKVDGETLQNLISHFFQSTLLIMNNSSGVWRIFNLFYSFYHKFIEQEVGTCNISIRLHSLLAKTLFITRKKGQQRRHGDRKTGREITINWYSLRHCCRCLWGSPRRLIQHFIRIAAWLSLFECFNKRQSNFKHYNSNFSVCFKRRRLVDVGKGWIHWRQDDQLIASFVPSVFWGRSYQKILNLMRVEKVSRVETHKFYLKKKQVGMR